jgi:alpha-amylase
MAALELRITPANVTAVRIDPGAVVLQSGESLSLRAEVQGGRGAPMRGVPIEWQSSDPAIAAIDQDGTVRGMRFGTARIAATAGGRRATVSVEVKASAMATISGPRLRIGG